MKYYGNLALRPERAPEQRTEQRQPQVNYRTATRTSTNTSKAVRHRPIPIGEKLLYLFTIAVVVLVAGLIIFRYAQIYQINGQIQQSNNEYNKTTEQLKEMQREVDRLSDSKRIREMGLSYGMVPIDSRGITITSTDGRNTVAMKP
ncbi:MAG: cell division protein FtsL [Candidatus Cohnella colombiensis]|uniref:Cell division protein FtsL n=1 Tax=Candidatus Cohnella colombiensis TaxID=3121368 RepID=A0AA95JEU5_9BACL|nr:MAG: cell division protein FtsL [Cohnella sp.]